MARQVLENGVILPAEYSDDWYDDMTSNLTKLDDVIGSDSEKLSSADVGAAALSNNYNDLDNLPTIPTVNDATLTIQKNGEDVQTFTANASSNVTCNITVPTKTSDLTNDSNFVDTSNSAVASGITSAKVTSYDNHIADTDIHVTTADKNKWNNGVSQSYVFRYSSTALVASSTNSNTLLDNTDNLKVGDKVIDSDGVLFSITAIDTANSTFTIGTALIDLAQDSDVVHTAEINSSGIGIIGAVKEVGGVDFNTLTTQGLYGTNASGSTNNPENSPCVVQVIKRLKSVIQIANVSSSAYKSRYIRYCADITAQPPVWQSWIKFAIDNEVVHKSGDETISGNKTFASNVNVYNSDSSTDTANIVLKNSKAERGSTTNIGEQNISFVDKNNNQLGNIKCITNSSGVSNMYITCNASGSDVGVRLSRTPTTTYLRAYIDNDCKLGTTDVRWSDVQTYKVNALEPSSLSLPSGNVSDVIDISGYITNLSGNVNTYTAPANGWISIAVVGTAIAIVSSSWSDSRLRESSGNVRMLYPVLKNETLDISVIGTTLAYARFIPCQGNV